MNVSCIVNAHREAHIVRPTIASVRRAVDFGRRCGLDIDVHLVLDRPDARTADVVGREMADLGNVHVVEYGDLSASRNHAAQLSNAKYLAFLDGDDLWCQRWLVDCYLMAEADPRPLVLHPEYNVYFGDWRSHVFQHVDMEDIDFDRELFLKKNFWTALSFSRREIYLAYPYRENRIADGFGYEDWTWNHETIRAGILHKVVPGTSHFVRKGKSCESLLDLTSSKQAIPRILDLYEIRTEPQTSAEATAIAA